MRPEDINSIESESGVIASLIHNPDFSFYSEYLLPNHFINKENRCVYTAICALARKGITTIDPYNIIEVLNSSEATRKFADELSVEMLQELVDMSDVIARSSLEEYKMLVKNVMDSYPLITYSVIDSFFGFSFKSHYILFDKFYQIAFGLSYSQTNSVRYFLYSGVINTHQIVYYLFFAFISDFFCRFFLSVFSVGF